ncbi:MAG TPA: nitronate monooxygenase [Bradyrhizobium sp.]
MIKTRLTERFDMEHPIVCAPMALVCGGSLAAAVSRAGGLGVMGGGYAGTAGDGPGLEEQYRIAGNTPIGIGFITWAVEARPDAVDWAIAKRPKCLFLSFGSPKAFARKALDANIPVFCQVQTMGHVREALDAGASVIVAQGAEAGGHGGRRSTLPFVPEVADLLAKRYPEVLLLAAGGIADGRGLAASLTLGADGVLVGSRFWAAKEALTPAAAAARAIAADGDQTVRTTALDSLRGVPWPAEFSFRVLRNRLMDDWSDREREAAADFGVMKQSYNEARLRGDLEIAATIVGEAVGLIHARLPAAEIVSGMVAEAEAVLARTARLVS